MTDNISLFFVYFVILIFVIDITFLHHLTIKYSTVVLKNTDYIYFLPFISLPFHTHTQTQTQTHEKEKENKKENSKIGGKKLPIYVSWISVLIIQ